MEFDFADLPNEITFPIWAKHLIKENFTYEQAVNLAKTYRSLNNLLTNYYREYDTIWEHFWRRAFEPLGWNEWISLGDKGCPWTTSWKSFFFWCLLIERSCTRILLDKIIERLRVRTSLMIENQDLFYLENGWQGPTGLVRFKRIEPDLPIRWSYQEAHLSGSGTTFFTIQWKDREKTFREMDLLDPNMQKDPEWQTVPIYMLLWLYELMDYNPVGESDPYGALQSKFDEEYPAVDRLFDMVAAFIHNGYFIQQENEYFDRVVDMDRFPLNPLGTLPDRMNDLEMQRMQIEEPLDAPRYYDDKIFIGCAQCGGEAKMRDPDAQLLFCDSRCQEQYFKTTGFED